jgi:RimJ/RimL family protein N-acetyltransferase
VTAVVQTERLVLRDWRDDDLDLVAEITGDEESARYIGGVLARDDAWRRLAYMIGHKALRGYSMLAVEEKASGACVGWCGPYFPLGWPEREIAWSLSPRARGRGYATEAGLGALRYAYRELGWPTAISFIALENSASVAVARRLGATLEGARIYRGYETGIFRHRPPAEILN